LTFALPVEVLLVFMFSILSRSNTTTNTSSTHTKKEDYPSLMMLAAIGFDLMFLVRNNFLALWIWV
jgi:hypothetical protein